MNEAPRLFELRTETQSLGAPGALAVASHLAVLALIAALGARESENPRAPAPEYEEVVFRTPPKRKPMPKLESGGSGVATGAPEATAKRRELRAPKEMPAPPSTEPVLGEIVSLDGRKQTVEITGGKEDQRTVRLAPPSYVAATITDIHGRPTPAKISFTGKDGTKDPDWGPDSGEIASARLPHPDGRRRAGRGTAGPQEARPGRGRPVDRPRLAHPSGAGRSGLRRTSPNGSHASSHWKIRQTDGMNGNDQHRASRFHRHLD